MLTHLTILILFEDSGPAAVDLTKKVCEHWESHSPEEWATGKGGKDLEPITMQPLKCSLEGRVLQQDLNTLAEASH